MTYRSRGRINSGLAASRFRLRQDLRVQASSELLWQEHVPHWLVFLSIPLSYCYCDISLPFRLSFHF